MLSSVPIKLGSWRQNHTKIDIYIIRKAMIYKQRVQNNL